MKQSCVGMLASLFVGLFFASTVFAYASPGKPTGFINDFAGVLSKENSAVLERQLSNFSKGGNPEVVVATVPSLGGDAIEEYANALFREWGLGQKDKNNGVLFLISRDDRKIRIEVGYGLEGALTDIESRHILDDVVRPHFRTGNYDAGVSGGVGAIQKAIQEELVIPETQKKKGLSLQSLEAIVMFVIIGFSWLASILGRSKSWWAGGLIGAVAGGGAWFFTQWLYWLPIAVVAGLLFDYLVSKNYSQHTGDHHPAWWAGGTWGGWDRWGGGGGFGGFGGGSSGGGGSSSSW